MSTVAVRPVSISDIAAKAGVSYSIACKCLHNTYTHSYSKATQKKVLSIAKQLGYDRNASLRATAKTAAAAHIGKHTKAPANSIFASRDAETAAMLKLRGEGHSNPEVAHRCGVCVTTVHKRIGCQPTAISSANRKLAGKVRSAKAKIKKAYVQQQTVAEYNELAAKLNAQLEEAKKMATELSAMQKKAKVASKATNVPLLRVLQGGVAS